MKNCIASTLSFAFLGLAAHPAGAQSQVWVRQLGSSGGDIVYASASDGSGGVYVSGRTDGNLGGSNAGQGDGWLAHYDGAGNPTWIRQLGTSADDEVRASAPDGSSGVFVGGHTHGSLGGPSAGLADGWLARYDSAGNQTWIRQFGTSLSDYLDDAAPDGSGGVFVSGWTYGSLGGPNAGDRDAWLARYDSAGNQTWIRQIGTSGADLLSASAPEGSGGVFVSGYTDGSLGGPNAGEVDVWLARYDSGGNQTWIRQLGTSIYDEASASGPDGSGGVFVSGYTNGSLGGPNAGGRDAWLARYDNAGNQTWIRQLGTSGFDQVRASAPDSSGGVYVSGYTNGSLGGPNAGDVDAWLARYDSGGNQTWIHQLGTNSYDDASASASDGLGGMYVSGSTNGRFGGPSAGQTDAWLARYDGTGPCSVPTTYCTPKVNSVGCTPNIGWTGTATLSGPIDDFFVTASNVLNRKPGIMIWSTQAGSSPLGNGTLCLAPPVIRTPGQSSGGSPAPAIDCSGQYAFHFDHAYMQNYFLAAGQTIRAQYWSRDSGFPAPNNIGLTNGLSFVICP